jgi:hypothetical protein
MSLPLVGWNERDSTPSRSWQSIKDFIPNQRSEVSASVISSSRRLSNAALQKFSSSISTIDHRAVAVL